MNSFHFTIVLGTRPEIIKLAPILRLAQEEGIEYSLIHTNQHYSAELDGIFFEELQLPAPNHNLHVGPGSQSAQTARMMVSLEEILLKEPTSCLLVQGDTNSVLAGALVASKLGIPLAHLEAGLRSHDRAMPEEINRIIVDHIADLLLPPTQECLDNLHLEGLPDERIAVVGNSIVDSIFQNRKLAESVSLDQFELSPQGYYLLTLHRPANVDTKEDLEEIFAMLETVHGDTGIPFFFPIHPRTRSTIERLNIRVPDCVRLHAPIGYTQFLALQLQAAAIFTDSGGIQEEACILGVPCLTLRDSTERPETVSVGANEVVYRDAQKSLAALARFTKNSTWKNPFGDGHTAENTLREMRTRFSR